MQLILFLAILLIVLKLAGIFAAAWWIVLIPAYPFLIGPAIAFVACIMAVLSALTFWVVSLFLKK